VWASLFLLLAEIWTSLWHGTSEFLFHALAFALRLIIVDSPFDSRDNATQRDITILVLRAQKFVTDIQTVTPLLFRELFQNLSWTDTMEVKSILDNVTGKTITNLQLVCLCCRKSERGSVVFPSVFDVDGRPDRFKSVTLVRPLLNVIQLIQSLMRQNIVAVLCWYSSTNLHTSDTFSPRKPIHSTLLFFGACG
jgi:hypothetical protein